MLQMPKRRVRETASLLPILAVFASLFLSNVPSNRKPVDIN
jgi:hypothetical protein